MSSDLLNAVHDGVAIAERVERDVLYIAGTLREVGLDRAASNLDESVRGLVENARRLQDAHSSDVTDQIRSGEQMMGGLLKAVLVGAIAPPRRERKKNDV